MIWILVTGYCFCAAMMAILWHRQNKFKRAELLDLGWVFGLVFMGGLVGFSQPGPTVKGLLIFTLVSFWGGRLGLHLLVRYKHTSKEDPRYALLRKRWGENSARNFFWLFQFEALLIAALSWPFFLIATGPGPILDGWILVGVFIWLTGLIGESIADRQLARFKAKASRDQVCKKGLWRYSRHPNYFFEWLIWLSYTVMAWPSAYGWTSAIAPLTMWVFLRWITGVPLAEAQALSSRGEAYRQYQAETSPFFPFPNQSIYKAKK